MYDLTAFQRDLLYIIQDQNEPNGLEIKAAIEEYYQEEINHGRLYPNLDQLAERGLITKGSHDKRTNKYDLSQRGQEILKARIEWEQAHLGDLLDKPIKITL